MLRHEAGPDLDRTDQTHFDWMFQVDDALKTWATETIDRFDHPIKLAARRLPNHRTAYLEFEGPLSRDRGVVTRICSGTFHMIKDSNDQWIAQLLLNCESEIQHAFIECQRIMVESALSREEMRADWTLLFSPGRYDTNR